MNKIQSMNLILLTIENACADPGKFTTRIGPDPDHRDRDMEPMPAWQARAVTVALEQVATAQFNLTIGPADALPRQYLAEQFPATEGHIPLQEWISRMLLLASAGWQIETMISSTLDEAKVPRVAGGPREMRLSERVDWLARKTKTLEAHKDAVIEHASKKLAAIHEEIDNYVDGAEDAGETANLANKIACILDDESFRSMQYRGPAAPSHPSKDERYELLELAWTIIANAGEGNWERESKDWQKAAAMWRDQYLAK